MVYFACPRCQKTFQANDSQQGGKFHCTQCGQRLRIPTTPANKTVLASPIDPSTPDAGFAAPDSLPVPETVTVPPATVVRLVGQGLKSQKFKTRRVKEDIFDATDEMLDRLGLRISKSWVVSGTLRHSYSFVTNVVVDGSVSADSDSGESEVLIDLSWRSNITTAAILLMIFVFPLGLVLGLVIHQMAQQEISRVVEDAFRSMRAELED